ncbi:hypothetical protein PFLG_02633 [Plasmodium falciparum RAJ116]|uniref:H(+)-exporting diphosphatase n=1 Tax=Plasmodium falciparum RAJ116 TaxID=580058 RepID=A0A0L0CZJ3_PLAFA|nr:hypothetical protein PFLG_02633 [Plasmodium falciparum RAJ116]
MDLFYVFLFPPPTIGLIFSIIKGIGVSNINIKGPKNKEKKLKKGNNPVKKMKKIASYIAVGAKAFLKKKFQYLAVFIIEFSILLEFFVNSFTAVSFVLGCLTSILWGYIGMKIAVYANVKTTNKT